MDCARYRHRILWILSGLFSIAPGPSLIADVGLTSSPPIDSSLPWLVGPLIAPTGVVVPKGHYTIQPFFYILVNTGMYSPNWRPQSTPNFYNASLQFQGIFGMTPWMDFQMNPIVLYNNTQGQSSTCFGDLPLGFDFQLLSDKKCKWFPGIKLGLIETFPTGKYQKLSPKKLDTDEGGLGSFSTQIDLVFYKVYHLSGLHFLSMTMALQYTLYAPVHVKGFNSYGGGFKTRGTVYPGTNVTAILSFEYTFNKNWVFSIDNVYLHSNKTRFSGNPGFTDSGSQAIVGNPSLEQLSFAPAIEYSFNANWGIIAGSWFSAAGRNALVFQSGIISFMYSH